MVWLEVGCRGNGTVRRGGGEGEVRSTLIVWVEARAAGMADSETPHPQTLRVVLTGTRR